MKKLFVKLTLLAIITNQAFAMDQGQINDKGMDINTRQNDLNQKLFVAVADGNLDKAVRLITDGAQVNSKNKYGTGEETPLIAAARNGHKIVCELLIAMEADVNAKDTRSRTALMRAAKYGHLDVVRLLIENGAEINHFSSKHGITALINAAGKGI
jgi:ankyrin repeat protein